MTQEIFPKAGYDIHGILEKINQSQRGKAGKEILIRHSEKYF
jgi:hypothetical protein